MVLVKVALSQTAAQAVAGSAEQTRQTNPRQPAP
jgi:hypothetical protein